ncbi:MAG: HDOD domain-containing protein [Nitrospirae bacterium]|nr:HDOD domain-containing protein [Candidatus Manganitrophaceae bacterium]
MEQPPQTIITCPHCQKEIALSVAQKTVSPEDESRPAPAAPVKPAFTVKQAMEVLNKKPPAPATVPPAVPIPDSKEGQGRLRSVIAKKMSDSNFQVPPMPGVADRILQMGERANSVDLAKIIANDQAITSNIIRIANSAYYGGVYKFETLPTAITRIGLDQVRILVLGFSMISKEFAGGRYREECRQLNQHAIGCAYLAALLSELTGLKEKEDAFLSGLLHDIGKLIIYTALDQEFQGKKKQEWADRGLTDADLDAVLSEYHGNAGSFVAAAWKLQPWLQEVVRYHHAFSQAKERPQLVAVVALANRFCHRFGLGCRQEEGDLYAGGLAEAARFSKKDEERVVSRIGSIKEMLAQIDRSH